MAKTAKQSLALLFMHSLVGYNRSIPRAQISSAVYDSLLFIAVTEPVQVALGRAGDLPGVRPGGGLAAPLVQILPGVTAVLLERKAGDAVGGVAVAVAVAVVAARRVMGVAC